jgi:cyclic beta-1,2-glucan synthetase
MSHVTNSRLESIPDIAGAGAEAPRACDSPPDTARKARSFLGHTGRDGGMSEKPPMTAAHASVLAEAFVGTMLVAVAVIASATEREWLAAAIAGAIGLALWRKAALGEWRAPIVALDAFAFAIFAFQRNDDLSFWQLVGPWADVFRFNVGGAVIAHLIYIAGTLFTLTSGHRPLRAIESISLIAIPFLFNLTVALGADWHMAEIAKALLPGNTFAFAFQVFLGRTAMLFIIAELGLTAMTLIGVNRLPRPAKLHALMLGAAALAAATPLVANFAQVLTQPFLAIFVGVATAAIAQAGLWSIVYIATGLPLDALAGRSPSFASVRDNARVGLIKGAIYGGVFMAVILTLALFLRVPAIIDILRGGAWIFAPIGGALAFPFAQVLIGSADGTPPFFGRLEAAYRDPRGFARGFVVGLGVALAYSADLAAADGATRFVVAFLVGALAYAGVDAAFDYQRILAGDRAKMQIWRRYALGAGLGGIVAGALGWYFDAAQLQVVVAKFWAYADVDYHLGGHPLNDFTTYPLFNKYGAINLGQVAGGVRLFWTESVAGVINWGIAAPLFSLNYVLLAALLERSLQPLRGMFSLRGAQGLIEQFVRVLRWGLWMSPIINSFLRQSPDPTWFNQDGAVRTLVATGADIGLPATDFRSFSLTLFLGLLAYDWLRVLIWFDHMGFRVATLVNLSFLGGDRADEAAGRFLGHGARTRAIPDGIRRFGTWAPLLIPFYIPRGTEWDKAWTGAEALSHGGPMPGAIQVLAVAYAVAISGLIATAFYVGGRMRELMGPPAPALPGAPEALDHLPSRLVLNNGSVGLELTRDGRGAAFVMGIERGGSPIDLIRRPLDPIEARGHFFYVSEEGADPWSIGYAPARRVGAYSVEQTAFNQVTFVNIVDGVRATMIVGADDEGAVLSWRIRLADVAGRARKLRLTSFCEVAGHETGAYARDLDFAGMHVETMFVRGLNTIFSRNRLLRSARADRGETSFFSVKPGLGTRLLGYEDSRTRFLGDGSLAKPTGCEPMRWRKLDDQGKLWTFDPAASFTLDVTLDAHGEAVAEFIMGRSDNAVWASQLVSKRLELPALPEAELQNWLYETRAVEPSPGLHHRWPFAFSENGKILHLTHRTPRPWAHVMGNEMGGGVMVSNDGEVYSTFANARQNGLTPFRFDSATVQLPGQVVYIRNLDTEETDAPGYAPFQRDDAKIEVAYEPGVATFIKHRGDLTTTYEVFCPPGFPGDMRILTLANTGATPHRLRVTPFFDIALEESPNESVGKIHTEIVDGVPLFVNPRNDFQRGTAFVATSLDDPILETIRRRFFGGRGRDIQSPALVDTGVVDQSVGDDGRRVAAFMSEFTLGRGESVKIAMAIGQAPSRDAALDFARQANVVNAETQLAATRKHWADRLGKVEVRTNRPDFDRLVNTWLPYQLYASRLFARVGPNQRGGATGYRDQLQDVVPLIVTEPRLARRQILLHAGQQFLEGDVLKWWHWAPNGATGIGQRTKACDPHLWLPYVMSRYVEQTGDKTVLDEVLPFIEGPSVPEHEDTLVIASRPSMEVADVYGHCQRAIDYTLRHMGANGLPLLGAGDWNDGIDGLGAKGIGTSVWMGFFFFDVLTRFAPIARARGDAAYAQRCEDAREALRAALEVGWTGDHYVLDFADDGQAVGMHNAMTTGWSAHSGAVGFDRAVEALEGGLKGIEKPNRVLLLEKPFFEHSRPYPGRIADYPPGVRENGGQYSHGASWVIDGFLRVAGEARAKGDLAEADRLTARAFQVFEEISSLKKTDPENIAIYGLVPIQQPADIYDGYGHGGRGGWSWYTGSAARMVSAAYGMLDIRKVDGQISVGDELFAPKGELRVESLRVGEKTWRREA